MGRNLNSRNDQSNGPYFASQKNHPNHTKHVIIDLSKMTKWSFLCMFKLGTFFLLDLLVKKAKFSNSDYYEMGL
jgi:hypothetical protein